MTLVGYVVLGAVLLGWGYIIGTALYHSNLTRVYRILKTPTERLKSGEAEANEAVQRKS